MLTYIDVFTGTAGTCIALEKLARPILFCDNNKYVQTVLQKLMARRLIPLVPILNDVKQFTRSSLKSHYRGQIDMVVAGSPCTGHSLMGKHLGFANPESALIHDLLSLVDQVRPRIVLLENTPNILDAEGFQLLLHAFAKTKLNNLDWVVLPAFLAGSPQNRHRWFCIAYQDASCPALQTLLANALNRVPHDNLGKAWWAEEPVPRMVTKAQVQFTERCRMLGNAIVPAQLRLALTMLLTRIVSKAPCAAHIPIQTCTRLPRFGGYRWRRDSASVISFDRPRIPKPNLQLCLLDIGQNPHPKAVKRKIIPLWPTPRASNCYHCLTLTDRCACDLPTALRYEKGTTFRTGARMNLAWVEWLMGFPLGWTST